MAQIATEAPGKEIASAVTAMPEVYPGPKEGKSDAPEAEKEDIQQSKGDEPQESHPVLINERLPLKPPAPAEISMESENFDEGRRGHTCKSPKNLTDQGTLSTGSIILANDRSIWQEDRTEERWKGQIQGGEVQLSEAKLQLPGRQKVDQTYKTDTTLHSPLPITKTHDPKNFQIINPSQENLSPPKTLKMEGGGNQNRKTEPASTSTPHSAGETTPLSTNLPATIPLGFLEQMFKTLWPDIDISQTLAYLAQTAQPNIAQCTSDTGLRTHATP